MQSDDIKKKLYAQHIGKFPYEGDLLDEEVELDRLPDKNADIWELSYKLYCKVAVDDIGAKLVKVDQLKDSMVQRIMHHLYGDVKTELYKLIRVLYDRDQQKALELVGNLITKLS